MPPGLRKTVTKQRPVKRIEPGERRKAPTLKAAVGRAKGKVTRGPNLDIGKFAGEVQRNLGKGVATVGREVDKVIPSRQRSGSVTKALRDAPVVNKAYRKALGK